MRRSTSGSARSTRWLKRGRDSGQAIGYLDDGTMVVVEEADHLLGDTVTVTVTNALQTSTGRLIFARVAGNGDTDEPRHEES
ncbi:MAG: TRAM domain-containing protein [Actinobacteria bacterium]|nr:MAG: TRAM domain-containing protein [Actinomycetota bacterium]